jgi:ribosomal protein L37E
MPLGCIRLDDDAFPPVATRCPRCGAETLMRFTAPCAACTAALREKFRRDARAVEAKAYEPKMNVIPNAVALKDD